MFRPKSSSTVMASELGDNAESRSMLSSVSDTVLFFLLMALPSSVSFQKDIVAGLMVADRVPVDICEAFESILRCSAPEDVFGDWDDLVLSPDEGGPCRSLSVSQSARSPSGAVSPAMLHDN